MLWWGMYETTNESVVLYVRMEILACRIQNVMAGAQKKNTLSVVMHDGFLRMFQ